MTASSKAWLLHTAVCVTVFFFPSFCLGQADSNTVLTFDFNDHTFNEANNLVTTRPVGVSLVEDRFGNDASAVYLNGHLYSYLNLGVSPLLKPKKATISLWVNLSRRVYAGKGYDSNPILEVKNGPGDDFYNAYAIGYDGYNNRFGSTATRDSLAEAIIYSVNQAEFGKWYHFVITSDNHRFSFYINGNLQGSCRKDFETVFLESDSMVIGHSANKKNERFATGVFDDIQVFHRVLSEKEIQDLYHAPNPNKNKIFWMAVSKWSAIAGAVFLIAFLLVWQRRRALKRAKEKLDTKRKLHEMEIRTLKAQMNPHFIFNSLNSIQQFIMRNENNKAELYLSKFSKLIRELLESNTRESLSVREEVEIITGYLEMESLRFGGSISFSVKVNEAIDQDQVQIPHMLIQPFIENAIWHGLLLKENNRDLDVVFKPDSSRTITCVVDDNGVGRARSLQRKTTFKKKSLALSIVRQRLELMQETLQVDCGVTIIDKMNNKSESEGTTVVIVLPVLNK